MKIALWWFTLSCLLLVLPCEQGIALPVSFSEFSKLHFEDDVEVQILRQGANAPWVMGKTIMQQPAEKVFKVLSAFSQYEVLFKDNVKSAKILPARAGDKEGLTRIHFVWPLPFPMSNRDAVMGYATKQDATGYLISWSDAAQSGDPQEGVRIAQVEGQTSIKRLNETSCEVTYLYLGELGGDLPNWIKENAWKHEPIMYFSAVRARLRELAPK